MSRFQLPTSQPAERRQGGFAVIAAIFLIVVLAALGAFMVTFSNTQQLTSAQDIQGTRAYWAARAGLEWGVNRANTLTACPAASTNLGNIEGFAVTVDCSSATYAESGANRNIFRISARATAGTLGSVGYVERSMTATLER